MSMVDVAKHRMATCNAVQAQTSNDARRARKRGSDRTISDLPPSPRILARTRVESTPTGSDDHEHHAMADAPEAADDEMPQPKTQRCDTADMDIQEDEPVRAFRMV